MVTLASDEGHDAFGQWSFDFDRLVAARREELWQGAAQTEHAGDDRLLDMTVPPVGERRPDAGCRQACLPAGEVDGPAIVGIDQAEIPVFRALVEIGNT